MNPTEKQIYEYFQKNMPRFSESRLEEFTAGHVSEELHISRNSASQYLNGFVKEGTFVKVNSRPVYFLEKSYLEKSYSLRLTTNVFMSTGELFQNLKKNKKEVSDFEKAIGCNLSLRYTIQQIKTALNYPGKGLPILIYGDSGTGKSYLLWLAHQYARAHGLISVTGKNMVFHCREYADNPAGAERDLFGDARKGYLKQADGGFLVFDDIEQLDVKLLDRILEFMDTGRYEDLSGSWHEVSVRLMFITKQNPDRQLMKSLLRRIPIILPMPRLQDRTIEEKRQFLFHFLKSEIEKNGNPLFISQKAMNAFMDYTYPGNLNEMKTQIKLSCADAITHNKEGSCCIHFYNLPELIIESIQVKPGYQKGISSVIDILGYKEEENFPQILGYYDNIVSVFLSFKEGKIDFETFLEIAVEENRKYYDHLMKEKRMANQSTKAVEKVINQILRQFREDFALYLPANIGYLLSHEIMIRSDMWQMFKEWDEKHSDVMSQIENILPEEYGRQKKIADMVMRRIQDEIESDIGEITKFFLFLQVTHFNKEIREERIRGIIICHGYATAQSIADTANCILGRTVFIPFDMPLESSVNELNVHLSNYIEQVPDCRNLMLLVDCGSVEEIDLVFRQRADLNLGIINNVSTRLALEVGERILNGQDIQTIAKEACECVRSSFRIIRKKEKKEAIIFVSENGLDVAKHFVELFSSSLHVKTGIDLIPVDFGYMVDDMKKEQILAGHTVLLCIGTINPHFSNISFLSMQDMISFKQIEKLHKVLSPYLSETELEQFDKNLLQNFSLQNVISNLTILNPEKVMKIVEEALELLQDNLGERFNAKTIIGLNIHICCLLERLVLKHPMELAGGDENFEERHTEFVQCVQKSFFNMKEYFSVEIPTSEIVYIYDYIKNN